MTPDGRNIVQLCQNSSASLEMPPSVGCSATGPGLRLRLRLRLPAATSPSGASRWTIATVGDGAGHARLMAAQTGGGGRAGTLQLRLSCSEDSSTTAVAVGIAAPGQWIDLQLDSQGGAVTVNGSTAVRCGCAMGALWVFAGEGYLYRSYAYATECVDHDLSALQAMAVLRTI